MPLLTRLGLPGDEQSWAALGFTVTEGRIRIGQVACTLGEAGWGFDDTHAAPAGLGVPYLEPDTGDVGDSGNGPVSHPNGVTIIDHVVYWATDLDDAVANFSAVLDIPPRRRFFPRGPEGPEMAFYRVGEPFIEAVACGLPPALVGVAFLTPDLDAAVAAVRAAGGPIGDPKPAVQGGRIAGVWRGHLNWGVAFMEPKPIPA
ncbi:VOC family protein [Nocardia jejuensis]|uniref:VOC family protein n=1 Tax=Nocardia jejuensis TaxID=328049 RepID=UPI0008372CE9|nr:VOC family protein [Nocardia jejuensis]